MRKRSLSAYLALLLFILPLFAAPSVQAAPPDSEVPAVGLKALVYPKQVTAGQSITFQVQVDVAQEESICCGSISLEGPSGQRIYMDLTRTGPGTLTATLPLDRHMQPGTWKVSQLYLETNTWASTEAEYGPFFQHTFTVLSAGVPADTRTPRLLAVEVPERAKVGEIYEIKVTAEDDLSGLAEAYATIEPAITASASGFGPRLTAPWSQVIQLHPTGTPGEMVGHMLMEAPIRGFSNLKVVALSLADKAGNMAFFEQEDLAAYRTATASRLTEVPAGLQTSPFLNLIHPGRLGYQHWMNIDRAYLIGLLGRLPADPQAVREHLVAELGQLRTALDQLRTEIYTDPASGLRAVPYATTGKWLVLDQAIGQRAYLLAVTGPSRPALTAADLQQFQAEIREGYQVVGPGESLLPMDGGRQHLISQNAAAYLSLLASSPEVVAALKSPPDQSLERTILDEFDGNLIYFMPVESKQRYPKQSGRAILRIPASTDLSMHALLASLYYQTGFQFGDAFFSVSDDPNREALWQPYVEMRGGHGWAEGWRETPGSNLAVDFAQAFLPRGIAFNPHHSYSELLANPAQETGFREMVASLLQKGAPPVSISHLGTTQVGVSDRLEVTVIAPEARMEMVTLGRAYSGDDLNQRAGHALAERAMKLTGPVQEMGEPYWHLLHLTDTDGRDHHRVYTYMQAPVVLDPLPAGTNKPTVTITGTTVPGKVASVGGRSAVADAHGRFTLEVPLQKGENPIRLSVSHSSLGARLTVTYEPEGTPVPVALKLPERTPLPIVSGFMQTAPYAIMQIGSREWQADERGSLYVGQGVKEGENIIRLVITNRMGNTTVWEGKVIREEQGAAPNMLPGTVRIINP